MKKVFAILISILFAVALCSCAKTDNQFIVPETDTSGGYRIAANGIEIIVYATGDCKYVKLGSADGTVLQYYTTPEETIILDEQQSKSFYHHETIGQVETIYENPVVRIFDELRTMTFYKVAGENSIYQADVQNESVITKTVPYKQHQIKLTWLDGKEYVFEYFAFENGDILISADAPDEINPYFTENTPWIVDIAEFSVINANTKETVPFAVVSVIEDEGIRPENTETEIVTNSLTVELQIGRNGEIETVRYIRHNMDLTIEILNDYEMAPPIIPPDSVIMGYEELQVAMMKVYAAESVI